MNRRVLEIAAVAAPAVMLVGARVLMDPAPAGAAEAYVAEVGSAVEEAPGLARPTEEQLAAVAWVESLGKVERSPMYFVRLSSETTSSVRVEDGGRADAERGKTTRVPEKLKGLRLSTVMKSGDRTLAVIDGRILRVGDTVVPGWKLREIDPGERTATLVDGAGTAFVLMSDR